MGIIHLSVLFLCVKSVKSGLIIPMQRELISLAFIYGKKTTPSLTEGVIPNPGFGK
jgi:hypothetical protein